MGKNMNLLKLNFIVIIILIIIMGFAGDLLYSSDITVHSSSELIEKFETLYIKIDLTQPFTNPYDPKDIKRSVLEPGVSLLGILLTVIGSLIFILIIGGLSFLCFWASRYWKKKLREL